MKQNIRIAKELVRLAKNLVADEENMDWFKEDYEKIKFNFKTWANKNNFKIDYDLYPNFNQVRHSYDDEPTLMDNEWNLFSAYSEPEDLYQQKNGRIVQQTIGVCLILKIIDKNEKKYKLIPQAWRTLNIGGGFKESKLNGRFSFIEIPSVESYTTAFGNLIAHIYNI